MPIAVALLAARLALLVHEPRQVGGTLLSLVLQLPATFWLMAGIERLGVTLSY